MHSMTIWHHLTKNQMYVNRQNSPSLVIGMRSNQTKTYETLYIHEHITNILQYYKWSLTQSAVWQMATNPQRYHTTVCNVIVTNPQGTKLQSAMWVTNPHGITPVYNVTVTNLQGTTPVYNVTVTNPQGLTPVYNVTVTNPQGITPVYNVTVTNLQGTTPQTLQCDKWSLTHKVSNHKH